jgi:hypothetical protein
LFLKFSSGNACFSEKNPLFDILFANPVKQSQQIQSGGMIPAAAVSQLKGDALFSDNRPEAAVAQRQVEMIQRKSMEDESMQMKMPEDDLLQKKTEDELPVKQMKMEDELPAQRVENKTGMPDNLKSGIENLSGMGMNDVKVHYNSSKPAQLNALAYAQGTDIHLGAGQEKHLPHEAWHVVQQKQGRVKPTLMMKANVPVNDDTGLEKEADVMGSKAMQMQTPQLKKEQ